MARGTTLVLKNHQQNRSFRSNQILKKKIPITSSIIVPCPRFPLFCFVLYHQSWGSTYTRPFKYIVVFGLKNRGRLIHELTYKCMRKYGIWEYLSNQLHVESTPVLFLAASISNKTKPFNITYMYI